mmetsp:Transcript_18320/g.50857  ORF Transcript_18320/g.50857 Transcript_18320/m.50857 type:complete len:365 (+) Transcript_18320:974-2068(+)
MLFLEPLQRIELGLLVAGWQPHGLLALIVHHLLHRLPGLPIELAELGALGLDLLHVELDGIVLAHGVPPLHLIEFLEVDGEAITVLDGPEGIVADDGLCEGRVDEVFAFVRGTQRRLEMVACNGDVEIAATRVVRYRDADRQLGQRLGPDVSPWHVDSIVNDHRRIGVVVFVIVAGGCFGFLGSVILRSFRSIFFVVLWFFLCSRFWFAGLRLSCGWWLFLRLLWLLLLLLLRDVKATTRSHFDDILCFLLRFLLGHFALLRYLCGCLLDARLLAWMLLLVSLGVLLKHLLDLGDCSFRSVVRARRPRKEVRLASQEGEHGVQKWLDASCRLGDVQVQPIEALIVHKVTSHGCQSITASDESNE